MGFYDSLSKQLSHPSGFWGRVVAKLMNKGNKSINDLVIDMMEIQRTDKILEIGFANGKFIDQIFMDYQPAFISGIDISTTMVESARKRNHKWITQEKLILQQGSIENLPHDNAFFDKVFTVNTIYFWPDPTNNIKELHRVLKSGGDLVIGLGTRERMENAKFVNHRFTIYSKEEAEDLISSAGFNIVDSKLVVSKQADMLSIKARKS
ncbi:class I SAM-dependent methyltransferase [Fulvivirgaceae bacterium BMA10]|uniref:Class I SAM-dependent methyltransferase n=1 Tax=Splendidivirga corallicola TaxID=3051826 RepID=A0ABT8KRJ6_9BACT|nr:class I SAM-dependent methyltransferase [Fulvivirgaceae bacterium BMA10]